MNRDLIKIQAVFSSAVILLAITFPEVYTFLFTKKSPESLKIDVNSADIFQLKKVPYIGEKTGTKIITIREKEGKITDLTQLKKLRYYNRFKYFLKVE